MTTWPFISSSPSAGANLAPGWRRAVSIALAAAFMGSVPGGSMASARAQIVAPSQPSVVVTGIGAAAAPAATATVQLVIGRGGREFGFSEDANSGSSFESSGATERDDGFVAVLVAAAEDGAAATPDAIATSGAATPEPRRHGHGPDRAKRARPGRLTAEELAPVAAALGAAANIAPEAIDLDLSPLSTEPFGERSQSARIELEVSQPTPEGLTALIVAASDAAAASGLVIEIAGVRYNPVDCEVLEEAAERAAIADARAHAERLARNLDVTLSGVVAASQSDYFAVADTPGCAGQQGFSYDSRHGGLGLSVPVFDPTAESEITVTTTLTIAYAIEDNTAS